jgi:hypothetical protein
VNAAVVVAGGLIGVGLFLVVWAWLPQPGDGSAARSGAEGVAVPTAVWRWLLHRWGECARTRQGMLLGAPVKDLELLDATVAGFLSRRLAWGAAGLAAPVVATTVLLVAGVDAPVPVSVVCAVAAGVGCSLVPALSVRERARTARDQFRRAVGSYLDLIAQQRAAGASPTQAITEAAAVADGWQFVRIRAALEHGRRRGVAPWDSLRQLAERLDVGELAELADIMATAAQGTAVATTLTSQAAALRTAAIAADQAAANETSERMIYPVTLLGLGFLLLLVYPAIVRLLSA